MCTVSEPLLLGLMIGMLATWKILSRRAPCVARAIPFLSLALATARTVPSGGGTVRGSFRRPAVAMLCGTPSGGASTSLSIHFERPVRPYLSRPGRKQVIEVPSSASLDNLRAALAPRLTVDPALFRLFHGKREIASDADLRQLLSIAAERSVEPQLRVAEPEDVILPPVDAETGAPPPPGMPTETLQMISFFAFHPTAASTEEVEALVHRLDELLVQLGALGTIYVACEGVNAQLAVAQSQLERLREGLREAGAALGRPEIGRIVLNLGETVAVGSEPPFRKRVVKSRAQILTDGLWNPLDWQRAGEDVTPDEWDMALQQEGAVLLDCRNLYESKVGTFVVARKGAVARAAMGGAETEAAEVAAEDAAEVAAEPLGTDTFAQSWDVLRKRLAEVPKDAPILTFCTGGIRCVKVNAFLEQELGFHNTKKLQHGIVGYLRHKREQQEKEEEERRQQKAPPPMDGSSRTSAWRGANFVFDRRTLVGDALDDTEPS